MSTSTKNMSQSMIENIQNYADQIITLEDFVTGVRQNLGMWIGRKGNFGFINMTREILQNSLDEVNKDESPATKIFVMYDEITHRTVIGDNGRGIPHGHILRIFSDPNTSSNYVKNKGEYSSGLHGVGSKVSNALSKLFIVDSYILGVHHRLELVRVLNGVEWYNDSASTSPTRGISALNAFKDKEIVLIAGGADKNLDYTPIGKPIVDGVSSLILIGQTATKIYDAVKKELEASQVLLNPNSKCPIDSIDFGK